MRLNEKWMKQLNFTYNEIGEFNYNVMRKVSKTKVISTVLID